MKPNLILSLLLCTPFLMAQERLSLQECHALVLNHAPRAEDSLLIRQGGELRVDQAGLSWLPDVSLNGKVSYQSDVVEVAIVDAPVPLAFPEVPHDQYGFNLDVHQNIYDGGMSARKKEYQETLTATELQRVEVDLYALKGRANALFFPILVLQENHKNLKVHQETLEARLAAVHQAVEQGALLESEALVLQVEILKIRQRILEVDSQRRAHLDALGVMCGRSFGDSTVLEMPTLSPPEEAGLSRPEHQLFEWQVRSLEAGKELARSKRMPVLYAYGQTGYGKPGYNMLSETWDYYYMLGAGLSWKIWDWGHARKEQKHLQVQQEMVHHARASFDRDMEALLAKEAKRMEQYMLTMELEQEVLSLQEEISARAATQLANGLLTAADYITELNKESLARIRLATHRIHYVQAMASYLNIQGTL